jgi:hypothetical protein
MRNKEKNFKNKKQAGHWWLAHAYNPTWEAEIRKM